MLVAGLLLMWLVMAYLVMPALWKGYAHRHPSLEDIPRITHTGSDIPGDPLNVALIGTESGVEKDHAGGQVVSRPTRSACAATS